MLHDRSDSIVKIADLSLLVASTFPELRMATVRSVAASLGGLIRYA